MKNVVLTGAIAGFLYMIIAIYYGEGQYHKLMAAVGFFSGLILLGMWDLMKRGGQS